MRAGIRRAVARLREQFRGRSTREQDDEFAFHVDMETAENVRLGMGIADARRAALARFGGGQRYREETRDARGFVALDNLARDARFAVRRLRRAPGFALAAVATLGVGLGAAVGIGTLVYDVLLRPLPFVKPEQLVRVDLRTPGLPGTGDLQSAATFLYFAEQARSFTGLGAYYTSDAFALTDGASAERVTVALMSPSTFGLLGVRPLLGVLFARRDTSWIGGSDDRLLPILISENLWRRRYGGDSTIIGRRLEIDHGPREVIGVLPNSFDFPSPAVSIWYPASFNVQHPQLAARYYTVIGRLRTGVGRDQAQAEANDLLAQIPRRFPSITADALQHAGARVSVESLRSATVAPVRTQLFVLALLVAGIFLIATANVVNLFLLRTERAAHEVAVAVSLGARRLALGQRFMVEGMVLGLASSLVAVPVAGLTLSTKLGFTEREIPRLHEVSVTAGMLVWVVGLGLVIGGLVGAIGLANSGTDGLFDRLRLVRGGARHRWRRTRDGLVALQIALALALLVSAGLLGHSVWNLRRADLGFEPAHALTFHVSLPWGPDGITSYAAQAAFHARLMDRLAALPSISAVGGAQELPLAGHGVLGLGMRIKTADEAGRPVVSAIGNVATAGYFRAMGIRLLRGRTFRPGDLRGGQAVIVSARLAMSLFGTTDVVGRTIDGVPQPTGAPSEASKIVGVVDDIQREGIEDGDTPMLYLPLLRDADGLPDSTAFPFRAAALHYVIRGTRLPSEATIRRIVSGVDRRVPAAGVRTLSSIVDEATARVRLTMHLIAVAAVAALFLGVVGVYGVVSYAVNGRMREFAIRLALGSAPKRVAGAVLGDSLKVLAVGVAAGLGVAFASTRLLRALLYDVTPNNLAEFAVATVVLAVVSLCAALLPALRAARTSPAVVLRGE